MAVDCCHGHRRFTVGPIFGLATKEALGPEAFSSIVSLAVAIILFEGSSNLDFRELKGISKAVIRIITIGAGIAWILGAIALHITMSFPLSISVCDWGSILITGPTVIQPLLKQAKVKRNVDSVLRWGKYYIGSYWTYYCTHSILCIPDF